ncbi:site-2 protease family protein [Cesiribacter andamanensis]|uniref:Regulator of sigma E protease n=1 Tax=Cesiribacter andamanensis AMV16 TaxID=1279009 RepID=M7MXZ1_9BACT|nr:site-2 protease family protein [Cesiribacter andamanensis]EMR01298.1 Regulator of sigma E protease [Cesiribacter andamanensis AMV16]
MEVLLLILGLVFLNVVYYGGKLFLALRWGLHHRHYFIGMGSKLFTISVGDTSYSFGFYIPLFGLSRIYAYESGQKTRSHSPWEFSSHPLWKRFAVSISGPLSLALAGILIFIVLAYQEKDAYVSQEEVNKWGISPSPLAAEAGFRQGDRVVLIDGKEYERYDALLHPKKEARYTILRAGSQQEIYLSEEMISRSKYGEVSYPFMSVRAPFRIEYVVPASIADSIGLTTGDQIMAVNDSLVTSFEDFKAALNGDIDGVIDLTVRREGVSQVILLSQVLLDEERKLGFSVAPMLVYTSREHSLPEATAKGFATSYRILASNLRGFGQLFAGEISTSPSNRELKGPIGISEIYGGEYQWKRFWTITAILAIWAAFMSILPLPSTPFWDLVPLGYEATTKRVFPLPRYQKMTKLGYYIVIGLMVWILIGDLIMLFL